MKQNKQNILNKKKNLRAGNGESEAQLRASFLKKSIAGSFVVLFCFIVSLLSACTHGQVHLENDYGAFLNKNDDKYFTNGAKFSSISDSSNSYRETYSLGQNIYTPSRKRSDALPSELINNRPYTGWLYTEYRNAQIKDSVKTIYGIQAGCSGRCSYAKETQVGIHKLLGQGYPTWDRNYSLKSEPGIVLEGEKYYEIIDASYFTTSLFSRIRAGNIVDSASLGSNFAYGVGVDKFAPEPIIIKAPKETSYWSYYIFGDIEGRVVPYNHFLEGSLFQDERHTVDANLLVGEANLGFRVGYKNLKFSYNYTVITDEWDGQNGAFYFSGIDVSW